MMKEEIYHFYNLIIKSVSGKMLNKLYFLEFFTFSLLFHMDGCSIY